MNISVLNEGKGGSFGRKEKDTDLSSRFSENMQQKDRSKLKLRAFEARLLPKDVS